jgi:hypothetical protein
MRATEWEEAAQSAQRALAEQIALAHNLAVDALRGPQSATGRSALNPAAAWPFPDPRDRRLKAALAEGVSVPKDIYEGALCYIKHVGSNWTMRGEPHPQQWLVDGLERCGRSEGK